MPIRNRIKKFIEQKEITRYRFAKDADLSETTAHGLFNNPWQIPSSTTMNKVCDKYRIQPSELIEWVAPEDVEAEQQLSVE